MKHKEKEGLNQYWYSSHTISVLLKEIQEVAKRVAFISTPSVYFSLPKGSAVREASYVLDFDEQWAKEPRFVKYDFNQPSNLPTELLHTFDCVLIDPPFITKEVWEKYAETAKLLLGDKGKIIVSSVAENDKLLKELLEVEPCVFQPSIPNLVYQYNFFTNYTPVHLSEKNSEIPD